MNVVVLIQGREAIPVRAIPFLTNWETMSPDVVATALAGEDFMSKFKHLRAYYLEFGAVKSIDQRYWENFIIPKLSGLSEQLKLEYPLHEIGYPMWQRDSWKLLPDGVFVWKDEWDVEYRRRYGPGKYIRMTESGGVMQEEEHERSIALDFDPFIDDTRNQGIVMAGFDFQADVPYQELHSQLTTPGPAPMGAERTSDAPAKGVMQEEEHERSIALDFDPFIDDTRNQGIVIAGFDFQADVPYQELHSRPTTPSPAPVATAKRSEKKPSIETVALDYMRAEFKQAQFQSAAKFHKHLIKTAAVTDSPFEMGTGVNAGKLFCPAASSFYDVGTLGKIWPKIRAG